MTRCTKILPAGSWDAARAATSYRADYEGRFRRRMVLTLADGSDILLDLNTPRLMRDGDGLVLTDGRIIVVVAEAEALAEIRADSTDALLRLAWHVGNRHIGAMIHTDRITIRHDPVIEKMVEGLGGHLTHVHRGFDPENGAYAVSGPAHRHHHHPA
ncbi:MAG: urease accessory protein UreE [Acetobacteraceae bacterium]